MWPYPKNKENKEEEREVYDERGDIIDTGVKAPEKLDARWLWDYDYLWLNLEAQMLGGILKNNSKTGNYEIDLKHASQPFMNKRGIKDVMALLRANVSVIQGSSITTEARIYQRCEQMGYAVLRMLQDNRQNYDIGEGKMLVILMTFMGAYEDNLRKSIEGKALVYAMQAEHRVISEEVAAPQPGLVRKIFG